MGRELRARNIGVVGWGRNMGRRVANSGLDEGWLRVGTNFREPEVNWEETEIKV